MSAQSLWRYVEVEDPPEPVLDEYTEKVLELVDTYALHERRHEKALQESRQKDARVEEISSRWAKERLVEFLMERP